MVGEPFGGELRDDGAPLRVTQDGVCLQRWYAQDGSAAPKAAVETVIRGVASEQSRCGDRAKPCHPRTRIEGEGMWYELLERCDYNDSMLKAARNELPFSDSVVPTTSATPPLS